MECTFIFTIYNKGGVLDVLAAHPYPKGKSSFFILYISVNIFKYYRSRFEQLVEKNIDFNRYFEFKLIFNVYIARHICL